MTMIERIADAMAADTASEKMFLRGDNKAGWNQLAQAALKAMISNATPAMFDGAWETLADRREDTDLSELFDTFIKAAIAER